jgi:hypothetical protein
MNASPRTHLSAVVISNPPCLCASSVDELREALC